MDLSGNKNLTTSATAQEVMAPRRGSRISFSVTNYGATVAWICLSDEQVAAVGTGIPLPAGTSLTDSSSDYYQCWQGKITAVDDGAGGATTIAITERVRV